MPYGVVAGLWLVMRLYHYAMCRYVIVSLGDYITMRSYHWATMHVICFNSTF